MNFEATGRYGKYRMMERISSRNKTRPSPELEEQLSSVQDWVIRRPA